MQESENNIRNTKSDISKSDISESDYYLNNIRQNKRKTGNAYERRAAEFLRQAGVQILEMNYTLRGGEIDIIGLDKDTCIFVEVKYRKNTSCGHPAQAVTYKKQRTICRIASLYSQRKKLPQIGSFRFDVIAILNDEIIWYKNAFPYHI